MIVSYSLTDSSVLSIPNPHDCTIEKIYLECDWLCFVFDSDLSYHDSIKAQCPNAKSLIIRYHLLDQDICLYRYRRLKSKNSREGYILEKPGKLMRLTEKKWKPDYISHYLGASSMIIELSSDKSYRLELDVDTVEYEWIESK